MANSLESKLMRKYKITEAQAGALVNAGLGYPHLLDMSKKTDITKIVGQAAADKVKPPEPKV